MTTIKGKFDKTGKFSVKKKESFSNVRSINDISDHNNETNSDPDYVFHIDRDDKIPCAIGGVQITMLIDSGSKSNLLSGKTEKIKGWSF